MKKEYLAKTKNNADVYVDMDVSHATTHFEHHPKLLDCVKKIIPTIDVVNDIVRICLDMGEEIGTTDLIETSEKDEIVYAKRFLRNRYSRFVKNKMAVPTSWVTMDLRRVTENEYHMHTAFVGKLTPSFPGGDYLPDQSREFWSKHALVWSTQEIVPGSETSVCPW